MVAMRSERAAEVTETNAPQIEGEIRDLVRRDSSFWRRRPEPAADTEAVDSVNTLISRVSGATIEEIERVTGELSKVRELLRGEGERISRELSGFAALSQSAMASMKIIADNLSKLKPSTASTIRPTAAE